MAFTILRVTQQIYPAGIRLGISREFYYFTGVLGASARASIVQVLRERNGKTSDAPNGVRRVNRLTSKRLNSWSSTFRPRNTFLIGPRASYWQPDLDTRDSRVLVLPN